MHYILLIIAIFVLPVFSPVFAGVAADQYGQYGGGASPTSLIVDKKVSYGNQTKGGSLQYVDNFAPSDARFTANKQVFFEIKVKNTSPDTLSNVEMSDILPEYIDAVEGPGDYNSQNRTIVWKYPTLKSGEERTEKIILQIKPQNQLPADKGVFCVNNKAVGRSGNAYDEDTAQFCIEKQVALTKSGVPAVAPKAGAEFGLLLGALHIACLGMGVYLRRKS